MNHIETAAERVPMEGEGQEWDTQRCLLLQERLLSSNTPDNDIASKAVPGIVETIASQNSGACNVICLQLAGETSQCDPIRVATATQSHELSSRVETRQTSALHTGVRPEAVKDDTTIGKKPSQLRKIKRDSNGRLRLFDNEGNEIKGNELRKYYSAMEDYTQKSSMSLTQENSDSAYERFRLQRTISENFNDNHHSNNVADEAESGAEEAQPTQNAVCQDSVFSKQHHSTRTDSTAHTYGEEDTGYVNLAVFAPAAEHLEMDENVSQDASFATRMTDHVVRYENEPQTPAPPINPFAEKGSVMKGFEMWGATQPSSVGRRLASPTSSRPSPDVYNDFRSPPKRLASSPLLRRFSNDGRAPLQSSVRTLLLPVSSDSNQPTVPQASGVQSFDSPSTTHRTQSIREPRHVYISMKESQERRRKESISASQDSESGGDSEIETVPRKRHRRREREQDIQRELCAVELPIIPTSSSRPTSSSSGMVEVPSTGRRRSRQEEYLAQCEGFHARDTQPDDAIIVDSQSVPDIAAQSAPPSAPDPLDKIVRSLPSSDLNETTYSTNLPTNSTSSTSSTKPEHVSHLHQISNEVTSSVPRAPSSPVCQPDLPLQELSMNRSSLRTPMLHKTPILSDGADETVPETSPPEDRIRPMTEIASISFGGVADDDALDDVPGFTQDVEFEHAIRVISTPETEERTSKVRQDSIHTGLFGSNKPLHLANQATLPKEPDAVFPDPHQTESHKEGDKILTNDGHNQDLVDEVKKDYKGSKAITTSLEPARPARNGLRSRNVLKGPSQALRRYGESTPSRRMATPTGPSTVSKSISTAKMSATRPPRRLPTTSAFPETPRRSSRGSKPSSTAKISVSRSSTNQQGVILQTEIRTNPLPAVSDGSANDKSDFAVIDNQEQTVLQTRSSKRQQTSYIRNEDSLDALVLPISKALFSKMAFAVSYVKQQQEKNIVTNLISQYGGRILEDGFDSLFDMSTSSTKPRLPADDDEDAGLILSALAESIGFTALIADEHSRKAKYMQALALGLPCISGRWILACISKDDIIDWTPYLLCAGQSSFLGNAFRSRIMQPYSAIDASFARTFAMRGKLLDGKSILLITGKGRADNKRKAYVFLTRILGPERVGLVPDFDQARKTLLDDEGNDMKWDMVYVDCNEEAAEAMIFGPAPTAGGAGSRKRKRGPALTENSDIARPQKKIRVISDEVVIQSLILGQLLE